MSLDGLHRGEYGIVVTVTVNDVDTSAAANIAGYTTKEALLKSPTDDVKTNAAAFVTDGTDGLLEFTIADGDLDEEGNWHLQMRLAAIGQEVRSSIVDFWVGEKVED